MKYNKYIRLLISTSAYLLISTLVFAQSAKIDSLLSLLRTPNSQLQDTNRINTLNALGWELMYTNPDTAIILGNQALVLANSLPNGEGRGGAANSLGNLGAYYYLKSDYPKALDYYLKALKIDEALNNKSGIAKRLGNIGIVYHDQADYPKALDYYFRALKMAEELGNKNGIARHLGNIGLVYSDQGDYPKALDYYFRALKMKEELLNSSLLRGEDGRGAKNGIAIHLGNIGIVYYDQADYPKALDYFFRALKMREELGAKNLIATTLGNIGSLYTKTGKFKEAEEYLKQAIEIDSAIGAQNDLRQLEESLSHLYDTTAQLAVSSLQFAKAAEKFRRAMLHYKKAMVLKDTIFSEENKKQLIRKEMNYEFEKKEAAAKAEQEKKDAVADAERKKQSLVIWSLGIGVLLVLVFAGFIFRALRITRKQKKVIELQKAKVEEQKKIVEEKQNEILASIRYAKRIQDALLPRESYIDKTLKRLMKKN